MDLLIRFIRRVRLEKKLFFLKFAKKFINYIPENSIVVFSDPRGGSTWLAEIIHTIPQSFIYWEPLSLNHIKEVRSIKFGWRQHIPENIKWPEAKYFFDKILSCKILNEWTTLKFNPQQYLRGRIPIIKFCRGNDLLKWIVNQYNFRYKPIHLVRHPVAVVASQLKQSGWNYNYQKFFIPNMPFNDKYQKHAIFLNSLDSKEEALIANWCITNKSVLEGGEKWMTIFYENLILDPFKVTNLIFFEWGIPPLPT